MGFLRFIHKVCLNLLPIQISSAILFFLLSSDRTRSTSISLRPENERIRTSRLRSIRGTICAIRGSAFWVNTLEPWNVKELSLTRRIKGLGKGGVMIPALLIWQKNPNLISMILRKTQRYNHICMSLNKIMNFYRKSWLFTNKTMRTTTQKNRQKSVLVLKF